MEIQLADSAIRGCPESVGSHCFVGAALPHQARRQRSRTNCHSATRSALAIRTSASTEMVFSPRSTSPTYLG